MDDIDHDALIGRVVTRLLRVRVVLDADDFTALISDVMVAIGAAAMREAEARAVRKQAERVARRRLGNVVSFPGAGRNELDSPRK